MRTSATLPDFASWSGTLNILAGSVLPCPKQKRAGQGGFASTFKLVVDAKKVVSDDDLTTASRQAEKPAASDDQTREACADNRAGHRNAGNIHRSGVAVWRQYVGNEDVPKIIRGGHVGNRCIRNGEDDVVGEGATTTIAATGTIDPESQILQCRPR